LVSTLDEIGWIVRLSRPIGEIDPIKTRQLSYFAHLSRHHPDRAFEQLRNKRVLILGLGGIGSMAAFCLAASGVRQLVVNDVDRVDESNLNRQFLYDRRDIGRMKVDALAERLNDRFRGLEITRHTHHLEAAQFRELSGGCDVTLLCGESETPLDHPDSVGDGALITAGYFGAETFVGPVVSPAHGTPPWRDFVPAKHRSKVAAQERGEEALSNHWNCSGATNNGLGGSLLAEAALRLLAPALGGPVLLGVRRFVDMTGLTMRDVALKLDDA
jgi:ThiF family